MEKTIQSINILTLLSNLIGKQFETLAKADTNDRMTREILLFNAKSLMILYTNSFVAEWDNYLVQTTSEEYKETVIKYKKIANPAIERIKKWTGIKTFRNTVLAHNFRDKNNEPVFLFENTNKLIIPDHISELYLLKMCIQAASDIISKPFKKELTQRKILFFPGAGEYKARIIDAEAEMKQIVDKINEINKTYNT
jgi:hypothetical protein